jgi:hypothetical protein
VSGAQKLKKQ